MKLLELIERITPCVLKAGNAIMDIYKKGPSVKFKDDGSPVTQADCAAEEIIISELRRLAPNILIISEENAASHHKITDKKFFLVDPLDGTKEFLKKDGKGSFTVNIGLIEAEALTTYGIIGIKVWIYKGEIFTKEFSQERNKK